MYDGVSDLLTVAIGCPIGLAIILLMSVPMLNARAMLRPVQTKYDDQSLLVAWNSPKPRIVVAPKDETIADGTAVAALAASSLMCMGAS